MIKAVVYDLDGTVLDTISTIAHYANQTLSHFGIREFGLNDYKYFAGNGAKVLLERMLNAANAPIDVYYDAAFKYYNNLYDGEPIGKTVPFDGIDELVKTLHKSKIKQAILSNKPDAAVKGVMSHFFKDEFEKVYGGREGIPLKPDPAALLALLEEFGIDREECLYVGDTSVDMETGKNAGITTVGVLWGFREREELEEHNADYIVSYPSEILSIVNSIK